MYTYLSKERLQQALSEEEAVAYIGLKLMFDKMLTKNKEEVFLAVNVSSLYYELSGSFNWTKTSIEKLNTGIKQLADENFVTIIDENAKGSYYLDIASLTIKEKESYVKMSQEEIWKIFNIKCKQKFSLLRFAVGLFGTINYNLKYGYETYANMPKVTGIRAKSSCQSFVKLLEESGCLYVHHPKKTKRENNGQIRSLNNIYGRPEDKAQIDMYYMDIYIRQAHDFTMILESQEKANITRNYRKYLAHSYTGDTLELIKGCLMYNKQPYQEQNPDEQKDVSVFDPKLVEQAKEELEEYIKKFKKERKEKKVKSSFPKATRSFGRNYNFFDDGDDF